MYWQNYINSLKMQKKHIERIPPDIGKEFANWLLNQEKHYYKAKDSSSVNTSLLGAASLGTFRYTNDGNSFMVIYLSPIAMSLYIFLIAAIV